MDLAGKPGQAAETGTGQEDRMVPMGSFPPDGFHWRPVCRRREAAGEAAGVPGTDGIP